jgi:hypothetical protein
MSPDEVEQMGDRAAPVPGGQQRVGESKRRLMMPHR